MSPMSNTTPDQAANTAKPEYLVVARRYRPQTFDELIGQEHIAQALSNAISTNRGGHAYPFTGARGTGKTDERLAEFDSALSDVLDGNPKLEEILVSALISPDDKIGIIDRVFGSQASPLVLNFLKVLADLL